MWTKQEIIPLTTKMRNKVKQYGKIWEVETQTELNSDNMWKLRTLQAVHAGGHPYECRVKCGKDFKFVTIS